jgi:glutamate--cysteine ligase
MHWNFETIIELFESDGNREHLNEGLHGLEKESLRVLMNGDLALTPHPASLGSSFTDPEITTDFSESQLELITPPLETPEQALNALEKVHRRVIQNLPKGELVWPFSMPCRLPDEALIPIARYGESERAQQKELYRKGLATRYGKTMQMLSGVHYNVSFSEAFWDTLWGKFGDGLERQDFINNGYMSIARNFMRHRWMLIYLFGASPVLGDSYQCPMMSRDRDQAVSLRLSRCGYANPAGMNVSYNSFKDHVAELEEAVNTPHPPYSDLGPQLNDNILQIINEYYSSIRLKAHPGEEDLLEGLKRRGVHYIELRLFDVNPLQPSGVDLNQLHFAHLFLLYCLFSDNPDMTPHDMEIATHRQQDVALRGQDLPGPWREEICSLLNAMRPLARLMSAPYYDVIDHYIDQCEHPDQLPWAVFLEEMGDQDFIDYGLTKAHDVHTFFSDTRV